MASASGDAELERARVCYVLNRYPLVSHTFIQREIAAVRDSGVEVFPVALQRATDDEVLSAADEQARVETATIRPIGAFALTRLVVNAFRRAPGAFLRTLLDAVRAGRADARAVLWGAFYFFEALILWDHCDRAGVHHIHAHFASAPSDLAWLATTYGTRSARATDEPWSWSMTVHGWHEFTDERRHHLAEKVLAADFVICISDYTRSQLMRQVPPSAWAKLHVRRCGIDPEAFPRHDDAAAIPGEVLCVGRLDPEKGHLVLLDALAELRAHGVATTAVFVGSGSFRSEIEARSEELRLTGTVRLAGAVGQDEIAEYYRRAQIFCLPTFVEGLPVVLMEAMASGLPVVTTPVNGIPELVEDDVTGLVVAPGRSDLLADALERLVGDPALREQLVERARARVVADHDIRRIGPTIAELFRTAPGARSS